MTDRAARAREPAWVSAGTDERSSGRAIRSIEAVVDAARASAAIETQPHRRISSFESTPARARTVVPIVI